MSRKLDKAEKERLVQPAKAKRRTVLSRLGMVVTTSVAIAGIIAALFMVVELLGWVRLF